MITCRPTVQTGRKVFRYFHMWKMHPTFENIVRGVWQVANIRGTSMYQMITKLKMLKLELRKLNKNEFSHIQEREKEAGVRLEFCQENLKGDPLNSILIEEELRSRNEYNRLQKAHISFLQQKSKMNWGKEGDTNSRLYHMSIKNRRKKKKAKYYM